MGESSPLREGGRPATEALLHTQRVAESLFDVCRLKVSEGNVIAGTGIGMSAFDAYSVSLPVKDGKRPDAFDDPVSWESNGTDSLSWHLGEDVLAHVFSFQELSVANQRDNAISMLASRLSRAVGRELKNLVSVQDADLVLEAYHGELMSNYTRWCSFMGISPVSFHDLFALAGSQKSIEYAQATESALMLLVWGEAGNLRFCPEFLCFVYHRLAELFIVVVAGRTTNPQVPKYLDEIIVPAYDILAAQLADIGRGVIDHSKVCNYDDFNEIFWQPSCLNFNLKGMFDSKVMSKRFQKTFVERQSWLVPIFSFWRVHTLHIVGLHLMIAIARCQLSSEEDDDDDDILFNGQFCEDYMFLTPVITLYACSLLRDLFDVQQALYVFAGHRGPFGQFALNVVRAGLKGVMTMMLIIFYAASRTLFISVAVVFLLIALALEGVMLTEIWWGIASYGKWGASTERSCSGGGFAACVPARIRHLGFAIVGSICGINAVNLYTQVHSLPPLTKRVRYIGFWAIVLGSKIAFSYFVVIKKLTLATYTLYYADGTRYDFSVFLQSIIVTDEHNLLYIIALWLGSGLIYFLDMQIWFVIWANIAAAVEGVRRRVGEVSDSTEVVRAFSHLHKAFFSYLRRDMMKSTLHTRFAHIWNEIVDAMREEDIISNRERLQLRYFLVNFRLPRANESLRAAGYAAQVEEGDWGPFFTLLPEFLMSGSVQRAVQRCNEYSKEIAEDLREIKREETLAQQTQTDGTGAVSGIPLNARKMKAEALLGRLAARQAKFLTSTGDDQVTTEMVRQLSVTTFSIMDALCRKESMSRAFWNLHRALFASDVDQPGQGIGKGHGWIQVLSDEFGIKRDKPAVKVIAAFSKRTILFSVQNFPAFISAMIDLVKALNQHVSTKDWEKNVASKLDKFAAAMIAVLEASATSIPDDKTAHSFLIMLQDIRRNLEAWREEFAEQGSALPGARTFKAQTKEFLRRTDVFLQAPANSQSGLIKGAEARRRIKFFVNSLFVEQPKPKRVLQMPSLTTLTPYYNEDVVLSIESLREVTQDGVTVLEYLRTIYEDEFENFVQRMRAAASNKTDNYRFEMDVVGCMIQIVLDPDYSTDLSREAVVKQVEKLIALTVKNKRSEAGEDPVPPEELADAVKRVDVDHMVLQLQMWASFRGQTLARTVRGIMYYNQAVRLLAVVENIEEFQSKETGYMFGSSDRPEDEIDENGLISVHGVAQALVNNDVESRAVGEVSQHHNRRTSRSDGAEGFRFFRWARTEQTPTGRQDKSFRSMFNAENPEDIEENLNQELGEQMEILESGKAPSGRVKNAPPPVPPRPKVQPSNSDIKVGATDKSPNRTTGNKFKAAVRRAMEAQKREREMAQKRGRRRQKDEAIALNDFKGFVQVKDPGLDKVCIEYGLTAELAEAKYRYVISCQVFGKMQKSKKKSDLDKAGHIKMLARLYPGLRIAYVDEKDGKFYSVLCKYAGGSEDKMVEEYRVRLPGQILLGEGKPNNQNHAIIFTRGEAIQAIDMNQDATLEDAVKIRQIMEEFHFAEGGTGRGRNIGRIVGFREHVFTHDVSAVANFFSLQELNFVSATQRVLDAPLHVRFHYGHPDVFDRMSAITLGGISKPSKGIHLSEDIFAGFNFVLRGGESTQADYIQVAKGRDTGVSQVTGFTAKISMGNGMQCRSREVHRLAAQFDLFRLLSFYYSSVGGFMNQVLLIVAVFLYVYAKLYIVFDPEFEDTVDDEVINALSSQFLFQLGFLLILPIPLLLAVEEGLQRAFSTLFNILMRLAPFFFIFSAGTNAHYVNSAIQTGQAKYNATGRGFVIAHEEFVEMFRLYLVSHFNPAFELLVVLIVYANFTSSGYFLETFSVYLLVIGLLWTPIVFNPNGLDYSYASQDLTDWLEWMNNPVDDPKKGWLSWYSGECEKARVEWPMSKKIQAIIRRARLLILVYGFLTAVAEDLDDGVDDENWPGTVSMGAILLVVIVVLMCQSWIRSMCCPPRVLKYSVQQAKWARLWKLLVLVTVIVGLVALGSFGVIVSVKQVFYFFLAFVMLVYFCAQAVVLFTEEALRTVSLVGFTFKAVHMLIGLVIMLPTLMLSFFPIFVDLQTRMLFNEDFSQNFSIAKIFARQNQRRTVKKND